MEIKLNDILKIDDLSRVRIRLNLSNNSYNALENYHNDPEKMLIGNFHNSPDREETDKDGNTKKVQGRIWFKEGQIVIGLAKIQDDDWLLFDISRITKSYNKVWDNKTIAELNTFYEFERLEEYQKYLGRLVVQFHKNQAYVTLTGDKIDAFKVKEILPNKLDKDIFPGYDKVNITWETLNRVLEKDAWKTALQNQKGVYLITDISNGKMYVGSAYGQEMLLGRWKSYVNNGHGGNIGMKNIPLDHMKKYFRYSILDIYKSSTDDNIITEREQWWKEVLQSRAHGYNEN